MQKLHPKGDPALREKTLAKILKLIFLLFVFLNLNLDAKAAVSPESIRKQVEQAVEARKKGKEPSYAEASEGKQLVASSEQQAEIKHSWLDGKIKIRKVSGQWYLSLGRK